MKLIFRILYIAGFLGWAWVAQTVGEEWKPAVGPLKTRWADEVSPSQVLPEYPRPTMVRSNWLNLNGLWDYAVRERETETSLERATVGKPGKYDGKILVPFPLESSLSGVMRRLEEYQTLWYRRFFEIPRAWQGRRVRLHFGAVDWKATVYVNGQLLGTHRGGYDGFSFDITGALKGEGEQELTLAVWDPTEGDQPRGKQSRQPEGIFYTPASGIWQTVWLEPLPDANIESLRVTPDIARSGVRVSAQLLGNAAGCELEAVATMEGVECAKTNGPAASELILQIPRPRLWSPSQPFLYDLRLSLKRQGTTVDAVSSYFGLRQVSLGKDGNGVTRILLNDEFIFQAGTLDQGFWPDGIYTAPTDAALKSDIETLKALGFNLTRKHVKVEPERWYHWCDKLGLLVWQDMPSGNNGTEESKRQFENELQRMVSGRGHHPSLILWIIFNEGWGQYDTERLTQMVKRMDPSRLVNNASGWTDKKVGDTIDTHAYPGPGAPRTEPGRAVVLGEFGGLGLAVPTHTWSKTSWGYRGMENARKLTSQYVRLFGRAWGLKDTLGLSAAVYTQTTDVETECNGLLTYDRAVLKLNLEDAARANRGEAREPSPVYLMNCAQSDPPPQWQYTMDDPGNDWQKPEFNPVSWKVGPAGFGTASTPGVIVRTIWNTADIWLRREFELSAPPASPLLWIHHDEEVEVYINGVSAFNEDGFVTDYQEAEISPEARAVLRHGKNLIAIHCHQSIGGQYIDAGLLHGW